MDSKIKKVRLRLRLELVLVVGSGWDGVLETLTLPCLETDLVGLGSLLVWVRSHHLPVIEDRLWEGLAGGGGSQRTGETKRLDDRQVGLDVVDWRTGPLHFLKHDTSLLIQDRVDTTNGILWALNLDEVHGLHQSWSGAELRGVHDPPRGWDDLAATSVDGIGVKDDILDLKGDASQHQKIAHSKYF